MRQPSRPSDPERSGGRDDSLGAAIEPFRGSFEGDGEAFRLFAEAFREQHRGDLPAAMRLYKASIARHPTAEAWTFLGWTFSFAERLDEAIACCLKAIRVDPSFGNPYNDIGAYLMARGLDRDALAWFDKAARAERYEPRQFPHCNAGIALERLGRYEEARRAFRRAVAIDPSYRLAQAHARRLAGLFN